MKKTISTLAALTFTLALTSAAAAQDISPETTFTFQDDVVNGSFDSALGTLIINHTASRRVSLVRPRLHFVPELIKTVENI